MTTWQYDPNDPAYQQNNVEYVTPNNGVDINNLMIYQLKGKPAFGYVDIHMKAGQRVVADAKSLLWLHSQIEEPTTEIYGSLLQGCARSCSGEHCCMNTYTSKADNALLSLSFDLPGDTLSFMCTPGNGWILTRGAFIAGNDTLDVTARFSGVCACLLSDEGPFLTRVKCSEGQDAGVFIAGGYGALVRHDIPAGKVLFVSRGLFFAAHESTKFKIGLAGGLKNLCCTGGGAIVMKFYGPSVVYTQSRNPADWNPYKTDPKGKESS
jgi:uncharacterized protein (AIM24 family)